MPEFLKSYYDTEGPFGLPMRDQQARDLESLVKQLPKESLYEPQKVVLHKGLSELLPGERADISWISEESIDRQGDIVLSSGMDDSHFRLNPLVTMNHVYWLPPVGKSLWRRPTVEGSLRGVKAKTHYHPRPENWSSTSEWPPDIAFTLVQAGLLTGKSVGFLPLKLRRPSNDEVKQDPSFARVQFIIEKWLLLEYSCVYLPAQQNAVVEEVSKHLHLSPSFRKALGWEGHPKGPQRISFTPLGEIEKAIQRRIATLNLEELFRNALTNAWSRLQGQV